MQMPRAWIFDLDNTLHDARPHVFPHINRAMTAYIASRLSISEAEAQTMRIHYWHRYGATLTGLVRHHAIDPHDFLWHTHQFPDLRRMLVADSGLRQMLRRLPGRKIVYTNSPLHYAETVLDMLGIARAFDAVYSIESVRFKPKPDPAGFRLLLRAEGLSAGRTVLIEDSLSNLRTARSLGMRTVWISRELRRPDYVDVRTASVLALPRVIDRQGLIR